MIRGVLLAAGAWFVASAFGLPIDPFLPVVIALGLQRDWPTWARVVLAIALAPLAAAACGDVATERVALYAVAVMGSINLSDWFDDGVITRTSFAACALVAVVLTRGVLAWTGSMPAGSETIGSILATVAWAGIHAAVCLMPLRARQ